MEPAFLASPLQLPVVLLVLLFALAQLAVLVGVAILVWRAVLKKGRS